MASCSFCSSRSRGFRERANFSYSPATEIDPDRESVQDGGRLLMTLFRF
jgi:hypothetical protein